MKKARILTSIIICFALVAIAGCSDGSLPVIGSNDLVEEETLDLVDSETWGEEVSEATEDMGDVEEGDDKGSGGGRGIFEPPIIPPIIQTRPKPDLRGIDKVVGIVKPIVPEDPDIDMSLIPKPVVGPIADLSNTIASRIRLSIRTADLKGAETDDHPVIQFCRERSQLRVDAEDKVKAKCVRYDLAEQPIYYRECETVENEDGKKVVECKHISDDKGIRFERGVENVFLLKCRTGEGEACNFEEFPYFSIAYGVPDQNDGWREWWLQGIQTQYVYGTVNKDGTYNDYRTKIAYWNPCLMRRFEYSLIYPDIEYFGPDDRALCAVLKTGDKDGAGTNDEIKLAFNGYEKRPLILGYEDYTDFERNALTTYGFSWYVVPGKDHDPYENKLSRKFYVEKEEGGDDWYLESLRVYMFRPGMSFEDALHPTDFHGVELDDEIYGMDDVDMWFDDDGDITYPTDDSWIKLYTKRYLPTDFWELGSLH